MNIGPDERDGVSAITDVLVDGVMLEQGLPGDPPALPGPWAARPVTIRK